MKKFRLISNRRQLNSQRGQTALEYAMIVAAIIIPLAVYLRVMIQDNAGDPNSNMMRKLVSNAAGNEKSLGIIGRPYP